MCARAYECAYVRVCVCAYVRECMHVCMHAGCWQAKHHTMNDPLSLGHSLFGICDIFGIKFLTKIRVGFSDLHDHGFLRNVL